MKKYIHLTFILLFTIVSSEFALAQSSKKEHKTPMSSGSVMIADIDELVIEGYNGSEVIVSSMVEDVDEDDRSRGLKLLNSKGLDDNTGFGIAVSKEGDKLNIVQISKSCSCSEVTIKVPNNMNISVSHNSHNAESMVVKNVSSELEITSNHHDVLLDNVTGPMAVKTVYGAIDAKFDKLSQKGSVSLYSVYELVDVSVPKSSAMNVSLSSPYGNVYSNVDVNISSKTTNNNSNHSCQSGTTIIGTVAGGGVEFSVKSAYEDVYFRTKE